MTFEIDAASISEYQTCKRKFVIGSEWRMSRWRPKMLFDLLLRRGIIQLSKQKPIEQIVADAKAFFTEQATKPGLDIIGRDPYQYAKGWTFLLDTVLRGLAKTSIPVLHDRKPEAIAEDIDWSFLSWSDDAGQLHRWVTVDQLDEDALSREMHSWRTFGDLAVGRVPMVLHFVALGQFRNNRHGSAWVRAYRHPAIRSFRLKFQKPEDSAWKPVYLDEQKEIKPAEWLDMAWKEGAIAPLLKEILVAQPSDKVTDNTLAQITLEAEAMKRTSGISYERFPMSRSACDLYSPCPFQNVCYRAEVVPIEEIGLYTRRNAEYSPRRAELVKV